MNKKHLFWIVPLAWFVGMVTFSMIDQIADEQVMGALLSCMENSDWLR